MGNGRTTLGAEDAVDGLARGAVLSVALGRTVDGEGVLRDDGDESCIQLENGTSVNNVGQHTVGRTGLALAVVAVVVGGNEGLVNLGLVGDSTTQTVTGQRHCVELKRLAELEKSDWTEDRK